ncbi:MAG TPA: cobalamin-binding protein [Firmicutes bacterium]|nr:cobalamin-binding protein [Bacillota bacterium]
MKKCFMKNCFLLLAVTLLLVAALTGCTQEGVNGEGPQVTGEITLVDHKGREVIIDGELERVISLSPSNTEIMFALGLGSKVVGVTDYCNYPPEAAGKEKVGGFSDPSIEVILTLEPDLVLAGSLHEEAVARLEERDIPVLVMEPKSVEQVYETIRTVAAAARAEEAAETLVSEIKQQVGSVQEKLDTLAEGDKIPVYYELWYDPPMSIGNRSFIHEVVTLAGGKNIFADLDDNYPTVSPEAVAQKNPLVILYPDDHGTAIMIREQYDLRPGWSKVSALQEERIYGVDSDLFNRPGPRVGLAIQTAADLFYPELFGN